MHGPTFMGNALACTVALKSIELFEKGDYLTRIRKIEALAHRELDGFTSPEISDIRIMGGCICIEVRDGKYLEGFRQFAFEHGVFSRPFLKYMYTMPPYVISEEELLKIISTMKSWFMR